MNLLQHPGMKLLSVVLAVGLWYGVTVKKNLAGEGWSMEVPVEVLASQDFMVTHLSQERVVLSGRGALPRHDSVLYQVVLDHPHEGVQIVQLTPQGLKIPEGTQVGSLAPSVLEITLDRRIRKDVALEIPSALSEQDLTIQLYPRKAVLSGPKKVLAGIRALQIPPVTLLGQYPQISIVNLASPHPLVTLVAPQEVTVVVQKKTR